jgi:radical SAM-linked protein
MDEDVLGIAEVGKNALKTGRRLGKRPKVTVSVSTHVPKPHTPFQWCAMDPPDDVARKQALLRDAARGVNGLALKMHDSTTSYLEGVFARGDRKLGLVIERAFLNGARFDSWEEQLKMDVWREAFQHYAVDTEPYLQTLPLSARLPWDHIDVGLEDGFLEREYRKALQSRLSPPCGKAKGAFIHHTTVSEAETDRRRLVCYDCGVACDMTRMRTRRVDYLRDMGALEPKPRVTLPLVGEAMAPVGPAEPPDTVDAPTPLEVEVPRVALGPERHRPPQPAGRVVRYRLRYAKTGAFALLGHLDLIRELGRVIRRAGMQVFYTQGFHPKPSMSFGPALSLGVMSLDEYVDVKLVGPPASGELVERLNGAVAGGLRFLGAAPLADGAPAIGRVIVGARYLLAFADSVVRRHGGGEWFDANVTRFLASDSVRVLRTTKGLGRPVDVRQAVLGLESVPRQHPALAEAGIVGDYRTLQFDLAISERGSAKITEVVAGIFGLNDLPHLALRWHFLTSAGQATPLELCAKPAPRSPVVSSELAPLQ